MGALVMLEMEIGEGGTVGGADVVGDTTSVERFRGTVRMDNEGLTDGGRNRVRIPGAAAMPTKNAIVKISTSRPLPRAFRPPPIMRVISAARHSIGCHWGGRCGSMWDHLARHSPRRGVVAEEATGRLWPGMTAKTVLLPGGEVLGPRHTLRKKFLSCLCFVLFSLQFSVCLWWHDYRRGDVPTRKYGVVMADLLAIC